MKSSMHPYLKRTFLLVVIVVSLLACRPEKVKLPLSDEQLVAVLVDIQTVEAIVDKLPAAQLDTVGRAYYDVVFQTHEITQEEFDQSMLILREDPIRLNAIYEQVLERLTVLETTERGEENMQ